MFNFFSKNKSGNDAIPAGLTTLSLSWLNGQFKAVAIQRGAVQATWESATPNERPADFEPLLREAVRRTNYSGKTVSLLLAHQRLAQQLTDVPPVQGSALKKLIQRQALQQKIFTGEAAWSFQPALSGQASDRVVLHLFPKPLLNLFLKGCQTNGLDLTSVLPVSTVLHQQLTRLGLAADDIALLAGDTGSATTVVVGRGDGQILLVRTLPGNWNDGAERLAVDLNRTTQFVNQQYGLTLNRGIWLFGAGADNHAETIQRLTDLPVSASPVEAEPFYWATAAVKLGSAKHPNFLAAEQREAPQRRVFARAIAAITGTVVLLSLLATGAIIFWAHQEGANLVTLEKRVAALQSQCGQLREHNAELAAQEKVARLIVDEQNQPVPGWFVAYMSQALPTELMISKMHLKQVGELWQVQLEGNYHPVTALTGLPTTFTKSLAQLTDRLANGPFHLKLLPKDAAPNFVTSENHFTIEGVMR